MVVIGITGGVGAGKTRVLEFLKENTDCCIILADQVANEIKEPGEVCYEKIVELLGREVLSEDGRIDRRIMAEMIFNDPNLLEEINRMIHPAVKDRILQMIEDAGTKENKKAVFLEAALLIEAGYLPYLDELWYLYASKEERAGRLKEARGYSDEKIRSIMKNQLSEDEFKQHADVIIDNNACFENAEKTLREECIRLSLWK